MLIGQTTLPKLVSFNKVFPSENMLLYLL